MIFRLLPVYAAVSAGLIALMQLLNPSPIAADAPAVDPVQPGPYAVGLTERSFTRASSTTGADRSISLLAWYPALPPAANRSSTPMGGGVDARPARGAGPFPVLLFSHGSGGTPRQSSFLTAHLASHGFVVIAPTHPGNTAVDCPAGCLPIDASARAAFLDSAANRPADISAALDQALSLSFSGDEQLGRMLNADRVGVVGHSFGGWTALQVLLGDPRFRVAVPMAPGVVAELLAQTEHVEAPTLVLAGDLDRLTRLADEQLLSTSLTAGGGDHWFVVLHGAGHLAFTDFCGRIFGGCGPEDLPPAEAQSAVKGWTTAFLQRYLAEDDRYAAWLDDKQASFVEVKHSAGRTAAP